MDMQPSSKYRSKEAMGYRGEREKSKWRELGKKLI
jgi:hypothetical protein